MNIISKRDNPKIRAKKRHVSSQKRQNEIVLETPQGVLVGETQRRGEAEIRSFKGIPYALPPVGDRRWKPAEPMEPWVGQRYATEFSPQAMQVMDTDVSGIYYCPIGIMSEDCLYLNVWAPNLGEKKSPVMVWIHGGSLMSGSSSLPIYDGAELARKGVVVVSINYRLNVFGYFSHPELTRESPHNASGNYGTTDQIQALKWIQENIAAFGGDPDNVTIFGESAGGLSVSHLLASPLAKGLFHRAISQSGYMPSIPELDKSRFGVPSAHESGIAHAKAVGAHSLAELRKLSAQTLLKPNYTKSLIARVPEAVVDGWVFPEQIFSAFDQGKQHDVPVLAGYTSGEAYAFEDSEGVTPACPDSPESYIADVHARYGNLAEEYLSVYPPTDLREAVFTPFRDGHYGWAASKFVKQNGKQSKAFLYYFDHARQWEEALGISSFHTSELPYVFNNEQHSDKKFTNWPMYAPRAIDLAMAELISDYWVAFAKNGDPNISELTQWLPYTEEAKNYMHFSNGLAESDKDLNQDAIELQDKVMSKRKNQENMPWTFGTLGLHSPAE